MTKSKSKYGTQHLNTTVTRKLKFLKQINIYKAPGQETYHYRLPLRFGTFPFPVIIPGWGIGGVIMPGVGGIFGTTMSQCGTSQHDGSLGSGTKEHPVGTLA